MSEWNGNTCAASPDRPVSAVESRAKEQHAAIANLASVVDILEQRLRYVLAGAAEPGNKLTGGSVAPVPNSPIEAEMENTTAAISNAASRLYSLIDRLRI